ncbi:MAG: GerMN domain-containing protein [Sporolactobacillus sp.]
MNRQIFTKIAILWIVLSLALLSACGVADRKPSSVDYVKNKADLSKATKSSKYIKRELFLTDANGLLVPQAVGLPESKTPIKQVLNYLVDDGPVSNILPNGFQAVLPPGTEIKSAKVSAQGQLTVNFSKELLDAPADAQNEIVQSIVWTATQFDTVKNVSLTVDGQALGKWPKTGTVIGTALTRASGINQTFDTVADVTGSKPVTVYYLSVEKGKSYDVPVTVRVNDQGDPLETMVNALIHEPLGTDFISTLNPETQLVSKPYIKDGIAYLHFNKALYEDKSSKTISDQALRSLVLTLTGVKGVSKLSIRVGNSDKITRESGGMISGPVTRSMVSAAGL